jgi:hypothetical protein
VKIEPFIVGGEKRTGGGNPDAEIERRPLTGTNRQQNLTSQGVFDLCKVQSGFTLVAQHLEDGRAALLGDLDPAIVEMHDMHLKCLHLKILRVSAIRAGQCHASGSSLRD